MATADVDSDDGVTFEEFDNWLDSGEANMGHRHHHHHHFAGRFDGLRRMMRVVDQVLSVFNHRWMH